MIQRCGSAWPSAYLDLVLINATILREAERLIESCEHCTPEGAEIPFDMILDKIIGSDPLCGIRLQLEPAGLRASHTNNTQKPFAARPV